MPVVTMVEIKKYFGKGKNEIHALNGINLIIEKNKFTTIIGSSGSGKTTLLNIMGGLERPTSGAVVVDGIDLSKLKEEQVTIFRRRRIGFIPQNYNLIPELTVYENIIFPMELDHTMPDKAYLEEIVRLLRLSKRIDAYPHELSGGQQQLVAIARALATKPAIILADEPTGNLDSKSGQNVVGLLKMSIDNFHQTLVMITHNLELAQLADTIIRLEDGEIKT